jgi:hypothetical protein
MCSCVCVLSGPIVQLSTNSINFMQIDNGETAVRTFDVINNSDVDAIYQVHIISFWQKGFVI